MTNDTLIQRLKTFVRRGNAETTNAYSIRIATFFTHSGSVPTWTFQVIGFAMKNEADDQLYTTAMAARRTTRSRMEIIPIHWPSLSPEF